MSFRLPWFGRRPAALAGRRILPTLERLEQRTVPSTLLYHHGPVLKHVEVETVFLGTAWQTDPVLSQEVGALNTALRDLTNSTYLDQLTRAGYHVGRGSLVGSWTDPVPLPAVLDETAVQNTLQYAIAAGTIPPPDANRLYFVFVEPGVELTYARDNSETGSLVAYHSDGPAPLGTMSYAVVPYDSGVARRTLPTLSPFEAATFGASHELAEGVTDPFGYHVGRAAWEDFTRSAGGEIADLAGGGFFDLDHYVVAGVVNPQERRIFPQGALGDPRAPGTARALHTHHLSR
jgi:hypothetical protein